MIGGWRQGKRVGRRSSVGNLALLCLPTVVMVCAVVASNYCRVATRVSVDLTTRRVAFETGRTDDLELLGDTRGFSRLVIERCGRVSFHAAAFAPVAPPAAASGARAYTGPVRIDCRDPDAKITVEAANPRVAAGALDRMTLTSGERVAFHVAGDASPVVTIDLSSPKRLDLPVYGELLLTAELVDVEPSLVPPTDRARYRAELPTTNGWLHVQTGDRRTILVVTPTPESTGRFFNERLRIPIEAPQFLEETSAGLATAFLADGVVTYPDYQAVPPVRIRGDEFFVLRRASGMEIRRIALLPDRPGLALTIDGRLTAAAAIGRPDPGATAEEGTGQWVDPRLTVYQIVRYGPLWSIVAAVAVWGLATTWTWYERWKKMSE
jgi:hypothetical protein